LCGTRSIAISHLNLYIFKLSDGCISSVIALCQCAALIFYPSLRIHYNLFFCQVMAHAHQLEYLNLGGCPAVTGRGITEIAEQCTGLDSLDITGCTQISRRFLMELVGQMDFSQPATKW